MTHQVSLSVISPVYCCGSSLEELCRRLRAVLEPLVAGYEVLLVDDGSPDFAWGKIEKLSSGDPRIRGIKLSRNFGQHYAITAGLDHAQGDWVVVMDCDLQDRPEEIPKLLKAALQGYEVVVGRRAERKDSVLKRAVSWLFCKVFYVFTSIRYDNRIGSFGVYSRKVVQSLRGMRENNRSLGLFVIWLGFDRMEVDVEHSERLSGGSSYTLSRMLRLAFDSVVAYSDKVLHLAIRFGFFVAFLAMGYVAWIVFSYFVWATPIAGWSSLIASIYLSMGLVIGFMGIIGLYVGKIFAEVKGRPLYVIDRTTFEGQGVMEGMGNASR